MEYNLVNADIIDNILIIPTESGNICIPEDGANEEERELFKEWRELYPDGKNAPGTEPIFIEEPVDLEKVAMAEAIIELNNRIVELENIIRGGE